GDVGESTWAVALPGHDQPEDALPGPAAHKHVQRPVLRRAHHGDAASRAVRGRHFTISCRRLRANVPMTYAGARRGVSPKCLANGHASAGRGNLPTKVGPTCTEFPLPANT